MYIIDSACISPQKTFDHAFFNGETKVHVGDRYVAIEPDYGQLIPAGLLRRMGKAVRMGVGAGLPLIRKAEIDGIILGTANGGLEDCLKFLNQIVDYDEGTLTPTNFVQSTPNAVAGNLAMMSKTTGYNTTHVHNGLAFECVLLDAILLFEENKAESLLIGSVEEISDYNHNIDSLSGSFKKGEYSSDTLFTSNTPGSVNGEGANMFVVTPQASEHAFAQITDVYQTSFLNEKDISDRVRYFLERNSLHEKDIDTLILGISGDNRTDHWYTNLQTSLFPEANVFTYKNMVGDYPTASAFAVWMAAQIFSGFTVPDQCVYKGSSALRSENVLIYNHYKAEQHGFILLRR